MVIMSEKLEIHSGRIETVKNRHSRTEKYSTIPEIENSLEQKKNYLFKLCRIPVTSGTIISRQVYIHILGVPEGEKKKQV